MIVKMILLKIENAKAMKNVCAVKWTLVTGKSRDMIETEMKEKDLALKIMVARAVLVKMFGLSRCWDLIYVNQSASGRFWRVMDGQNEFASKIVVETLCEDGCRSQSIDSGISHKDHLDLHRENLKLSELSRVDLDRFLEMLLLEERAWVQTKSRMFRCIDLNTGEWTKRICCKSLEDACEQVGCCLEELELLEALAGRDV